MASDTLMSKLLSNGTSPLDMNASSSEISPTSKSFSGVNGKTDKVKLSQSERLEWELYRMVVKKTQQAAAAGILGEAERDGENAEQPWTILNVPVSSLHWFLPVSFFLTLFFQLVKFSLS